MNRQRKQPTRESAPTVGSIVPEPHSQVYTGRNAIEDRLITTLMLAGEAVAQASDPTCTADQPVTHAHPKEVVRPTFFDDFDGLLAILRQIDSWVAADPRRAELMEQLRIAIGDGDALRLLFRRFFPEQVTPRTVDADKKVVLSEREIEVLRSAAADRSHEEIAAHLGIAPRTVNRHLENIYRKLGVHRPMQAVARAVAMGYLDMDALQLVYEASRCNVREFAAFDTLLNHAGNGARYSNMKMYVEFGLLLMLLAGTAAMAKDEANSSSSCPIGVVCELDMEGRIVRSLGEGRIGQPGCLAVAPLASANRGFTPGHLYVAHYRLPSLGLNSGAVSEFSSDGRFILAFHGGKEVSTRLCGPTGLTFTTDGRMLVTSGWLTDTILIFSDGGAMVRQFAHCCCPQACIDAAGKVYAIQQSGIGCIVKVFAANGTLLHTLGGTAPGVYYRGIAINMKGEVFVIREDGLEAEIEVYDLGGKPLRSFGIHGYALPRGLPVEPGALAIDDQNRLYVPCWRTGDLTILSPEGAVLKRIDFEGKIVPYAVAFGQDERMWVSGTLTS